ncbi:MAG: hypothetical protein IT349_16955 [Candidatus Eisenbacteria bacterium]|nr:hypothetical protein [Candidatus Eisenbacteria bacterium]
MTRSRTTLGALFAGLFLTGVPGNCWGDIEVGSLSHTGLTATSDSRGATCGTLLWHSDGTWENGIAYSATWPRYYGAFAECYSGTGEVCSVRAAFACYWEFRGSKADILVWGDAGGIPGEVLCLVPDWQPDFVPQWPEVRVFDIPVTGCCVDGPFWVGFWGNWTGGAPEDFYILIDNSPGSTGCSYTNPPPEWGFPEGWQPATILGVPLKNLGLGVELRECLPVGAERSTWGRVKSLYRGSDAVPR